jgi:hypothetical protein
MTVAVSGYIMFGSKTMEEVKASKYDWTLNLSFM